MYLGFISVSDLFQVVRAMEGNLFWHPSEFFLDQTGEIFLHMVFPQYQILFKCLFKTSNGDACWERWNTSPLRWKRHNTHKHWVTGLPKQRLECKMSNVLLSLNTSLRPNIQLWTLTPCWCLILNYLERTSSAARTSRSALLCRWQPDSRAPELTLHRRTNWRYKIWSVANKGAPPPNPPHPMCAYV